MRVGIKGLKYLQGQWAFEADWGILSEKLVGVLDPLSKQSLEKGGAFREEPLKVESGAVSGELLEEEPGAVGGEPLEEEPGAVGGEPLEKN